MAFVGTAGEPQVSSLFTHCVCGGVLGTVSPEPRCPANPAAAFRGGAPERASDGVIFSLLSILTPSQFKGEKKRNNISTVVCISSKTLSLPPRAHLNYDFQKFGGNLCSWISYLNTLYCVYLEEEANQPLPSLIGRVFGTLPNGVT